MDKNILNIDNIVAESPNKKLYDNSFTSKIKSLNIPEVSKIEVSKNTGSLNDDPNDFQIVFTLNELHTNLILISKISAGNKLIIQDNLLNIDVSSMPSVSRWFQSVDRSKCVNFIKNVMKQTYNKIDEIIKDTKYNASMSEDRNIAIQRFQSELKNSIEGLLNLKVTYNKDLLTVSSIDVIIDDIQNRITFIDGLLKIKI